MSQGVPATDPLRVFLSGKREHERYVVSITVEVGGVRNQFGARCVDISHGGALLALSLDALESHRRQDEDAFGVVAREFSEGFDVCFLEEGIAVEAHAVRLCIPPGGDGLVYLGCRFAESLSAGLQDKLGFTGLLES